MKALYTVWRQGNGRQCLILLNMPVHFTGFLFFFCFFLYPPDVLMVSPDVLNTPRCSQDILPICSRYPPDMLMVSSRCAEHPRCTQVIPPMYSWYPPDVMKKCVYTGWLLKIAKMAVMGHFCQTMKIAYFVCTSEPG